MVVLRLDSRRRQRVATKPNGMKVTANLLFSSRKSAQRSDLVTSLPIGGVCHVKTSAALDLSYIFDGVY